MIERIFIFLTSLASIRQLNNITTFPPINANDNPDNSRMKKTGRGAAAVQTLKSRRFRPAADFSFIILSRRISFQKIAAVSYK